MMCAVALRLKIAGHVWKTVKFLDFRIHGESFISRLPFSSDGLLSCGCVQSNPRSLLQSNSRLLCQCVSVFTYDFKKKHWWQYPGCQRVFMRGFRFRLSLKKVIRANFFSRLRRSCHRPAADETLRHTRENTSGAQGMMTRISFSFLTFLHFSQNSTNIAFK